MKIGYFQTQMQLRLVLLRGHCCCADNIKVPFIINLIILNTREFHLPHQENTDSARAIMSFSRNFQLFRFSKIQNLTVGMINGQNYFSCEVDIGCFIYL